MATPWGRGRVAEKFERDHVQHIYDEIAPRLGSIQHKAWPNVKKFLKLLHPGALVADIGCGNGRYLNINRRIYKVGLDSCCPLIESCRSKGHEVMYGDNLSLPFRDNLFDAVISIGVIHHFSSEERRLRAVQELTRILRPGGKLMIYVWAFEQKHRRFDSQDVLVPWHGGHHGENSKMKSHGSDQSFSSTSSLSEDDDAEKPSFQDSYFHNQQDSTQQLQNSAESLVQCRNAHSYRHSLSQESKSSFTNSYKLLDNVSSSCDKDRITQECRKLEVSIRALSADCICHEQSVSQDGSLYRWSHTEEDGIMFDETSNKFDCSDQMTIQNKSLSSKNWAKISETVNERSLLNENTQGAKYNNSNEKFSLFKKSNMKSLDLGNFEAQVDEVFYPMMSSHCGIPRKIVNSSKSESVLSKSDEKKHRLSLFEILKMKFMKFLDDDYDIEENKMKNNIERNCQKNLERLELRDDSCFFPDQFCFENRVALSNNLCSFPFSFAVREFPLSSCAIFRQSSVLDTSDDCIGMSHINASLNQVSLQCVSEEKCQSPLSNLKSTFDAEERQNYNMASFLPVNNQNLEPVSGIHNFHMTGTLETSAQSNMEGNSYQNETNNHNHNNKEEVTSDHKYNYSNKDSVHRQTFDSILKVERECQRALKPKFYINQENMLEPNDTVSLEEDYHCSNFILGNINLASIESSSQDNFVIHSYEKDRCQILPAADVDLKWNGKRNSKKRNDGKIHSFGLYKEVGKSVNKRSMEYNCQPHLQCQQDVKNVLSTASMSNSLAADKKRSETGKTNKTIKSGQSFARNTNFNSESLHQVPEGEMKNAKMSENCHKEKIPDISHLSKVEHLGIKTESESFNSWHPLAEEPNVKYNPPNISHPDSSDLHRNAECESPYMKNSQHLKGLDMCKKVESPSPFDMTRHELCRFYHVFRKGELEQLISGHIGDLRTVHSMFDHSNWCVVAEKIKF
ncbi:hypothetical protein CHS0354_037144 [Potamilus streckersoni]|uniref:Methyltransferase type 11 domain-containing protein n=1 Tax=Potamilus streckersoni TaxID=2493646 RepID=A0AAE0VGT9_9BIVA|nr:hypothetical protein CHS0354_037144 [Potamilus streckersoni]